MIYKIYATLLIVIFYGAYFFKNLSLKRHGTKVYQLGKGLKNKATIIKEQLLKTLTVFIVIIQLLCLFYVPYGFPVLGLTLTTIGVSIFIISIINMRHSWRVGIANEKVELITNGIYKFSRNPAFLGFDLMYIGLLITFPNYFLLVATLITMIVLHLQILEEEKHLTKSIGQKYIAYKSTTRRYF